MATNFLNSRSDYNAYLERRVTFVVYNNGIIGEFAIELNEFNVGNIDGRNDGFMYHFYYTPKEDLDLTNVEAYISLTTLDKEFKRVDVPQQLYTKGQKHYLGMVFFQKAINEEGGFRSATLETNVFGDIASTNFNIYVSGRNTLYKIAANGFTGIIGQGVSISLVEDGYTNQFSMPDTIKVYYRWFDKQLDLYSGARRSDIRWTVPESFWNDIPDSYDGQGFIVVEFKNKNNDFSSRNWTLFTLEVPERVRPTITALELVDAHAKTRSLLNSQAFVQVLSNIQATVGAAGIYGSRITGYQIEIVGKSQTTNMNSGTLGMMDYSGNITIRATVTDSRGRRSLPFEKTVLVLPYHKPILSFSVERAGTKKEQLVITRTARIAPLMFNGRQYNRFTLNFKTGVLGGSLTTNTGAACMDTTGLYELVNSQALLAGTFSLLTPFDVVGSLEDSFTSSGDVRQIVATDEVVLSYDKDNRFATGKVTDSQLPKGSIESTGGFFLNGKPIQNHQLSTDAGYCINTLVHPDTITLNGFYYLRDAPVSPSGRTGYLLVQSYSDGSYTNQTFTDVFDGRIYSRRRVNGVWQPWKELLTSDSYSLKFITQALPYSLNATLTRKGDMVTVTLNRRITSIEIVEYKQMTEMVPLGYRPTAEVHMTIVPSGGSFTRTPSLLHLATDGTLRVTNGTIGSHVFTGTITYITNDPYPS